MPTYYRTDRMILPDDPAAKEALNQLVREVNAKKVEENFNLPEQAIVHDVTWEIIPGVELYLAEDIQSGCSCVVILGHEEPQVSKYANLIKRYLRPLEQEDLLSSVAQAPDDVIRARVILRAGFGAPHDFDERFYNLIQDAMFDENIWVRTAAVKATQYSPWPQYRDCLRRVAAEEPDPTVREEAHHLVESLDQSGDENQEGGQS